MLDPVWRCDWSDLFPVYRPHPHPPVQPLQPRPAHLLRPPELALPSEDHEAPAAHHVDRVRPHRDVPQADPGGGGAEDEVGPSVDLQSPPALLADAGVGGEGGVEEGGEEESDDCRRHREGSEASEERGTRRTFIPVTSRQALESSSKK